MQIKGVMGLLIAVLFVQIENSALAIGVPSWQNKEATTLKRGDFIRILKPLPRRNSGCETVFRDGQVVDTCDPNYGVDPAVDGVLQSYCEWNLNTHQQKLISSKWLEPYFNPNLIRIEGVTVGFSRHDENRTLIHQMLQKEAIIYRWIEIKFNDGIKGSLLGALKCYPSKVSEYIPGNKKLFGNFYYHDDYTAEENAKKIKSGLTVQDILNHLNSYIEFIPRG